MKADNPESRLAISQTPKQASLFGLLQIEHMSRSTGVFAVRSGGNEGFLHLAGGELIHAEYQEVEGEQAALEILSWKASSFQSSVHPLAQESTITSPLAVLLLKLAMQSEERREAQTVEALERTAVDASPGDQGAGPTRADLGPQSLRASTTGVRPTPSNNGSGDPPHLIARVRLNSKGVIVDGQGTGVEEFAERISDASRMAQLIGESLHSGKPRALVCRGRSTKTLIEWVEGGDLLGQLRPTKRL